MPWHIYIVDLAVYLYLAILWFVATDGKFLCRSQLYSYRRQNLICHYSYSVLKLYDSVLCCYSYILSLQSLCSCYSLCWLSCCFLKLLNWLTLQSLAQSALTVQSFLVSSPVNFRSFDPLLSLFKAFSFKSQIMAWASVPAQNDIVASLQAILFFSAHMHPAIASQLYL